MNARAKRGLARKGIKLVVAAALSALAGCADGEKLDKRAAADRPRALLAPAPEGALPPPAAMFAAAEAGDQQSRRLLEDARRDAGLPAGAAVERVSFLDLPDEVWFAAPSSGVGFALTPLTGAPGGISAQLRSSMLDALGGPKSRRDAYLAARRFLMAGRAAAAHGIDGVGFLIEWRVSDSAGDVIGEITERWRAPTIAAGADPWDAARIADLVGAARRSAERILALPEVSSAFRARASEGWVGFGGLDPAAGGDAVAEDGAKRRWPEGRLRPLVVSRASGPPPRAAAALEAAIALALSDAGAPLASAAAAREFRDLYVVTAQVDIIPHGENDEARIVWRVLRGGRSLGAVRQSNLQPRGAFDGEWGPHAAAAARHAAPGLLELVAIDRGVVAGR